MTTRSSRSGATTWRITDGTAIAAQTASKTPAAAVTLHRLVTAAITTRTATAIPVSGTIDCSTTTMPTLLSIHTTPRSDTARTTQAQRSAVSSLAPKLLTLGILSCQQYPLATTRLEPVTEPAHLFTVARFGRLVAARSLGLAGWWLHRR